MAARDIFDKAVELTQGETLLIPCYDSRQQESMRVSLAYQRRYFLDKSEANFDIIVHKVTQNGRPFISLTKSPRIDTGFIISQDGSTRTTSLKPDPVSEITREALQVSRIRSAMKEDGFTDEQIDNYLKSPQEVSKIDTSECVLSSENLEEK